MASHLNISRISFCSSRKIIIKLFHAFSTATSIEQIDFMEMWKTMFRMATLPPDRCIAVDVPRDFQQIEIN